MFVLANLLELLFGFYLVFVFFFLIIFFLLGFQWVGRLLFIEWVGYIVGDLVVLF